MKFSTHNDKEINIGGTFLIAEIKTTYSKLVSLFGEPTVGDEYKIDAEWEIEFEDGTVATIYNWKDGKNYCGANGKSVQQIKHWHIGGRDRKTFDNLQVLFGVVPKIG